MLTKISFKVLRLLLHTVYMRDIDRYIMELNIERDTENREEGFYSIESSWLLLNYSLFIIS